MPSLAKLAEVQVENAHIMAVRAYLSLRHANFCISLKLKPRLGGAFMRALTGTSNHMHLPSRHCIEIRFGNRLNDRIIFRCFNIPILNVAGAHRSQLFI